MVGPHQRDLRMGRVSVPGGWYSVTTCTLGREPLLVADPRRPAAQGQGADVVLACARWLHEAGRWLCHAHCVMPDHVHLVVEVAAQEDLAALMDSFKGFSARRVNEAVGRRGPVWQRGYYDHALRRDESFEAVARYVLENPVRKGFVARAEDWPWSGLTL